MAVPTKCTVLVIGGGPAGSFAAASLAREGIDVVMLEADQHPRYHIGESLLPSIRHFLRFIGADDKFKSFGFMNKNGAAFKLNRSQPPAYTDFIAANGPDGHSWNVVRSQADEILFRHAEECGAHVFDCTKVTDIQFEDPAAGSDEPVGRPVSVTWSRKADGSTGTVNFEYLVDASGRNGLISTKYLKNRKFNQGLKNIANWGYWKGHGKYGVGEQPPHKEGSPFFEAISDGSGWTWFIPLHDGTVSVGVVQNQDMATAKKRAMNSPSSREFYDSNVALCPGISALLQGAELVSENIKSASDWSYSAPTYALPHARIVGDAGAFIDPYFSSGVHMAALGGISAALTICASIRGDCAEDTAASWHTKKIAESYTRFFLVVSSATKQIRAQEDPVIQDLDEEGFQRAFDLFRPVIQGSADANATGKLTKAEVSKTVEFCFKAFTPITAAQRDTVAKKLEALGLDAQSDDAQVQGAIDALEKSLTPEENEVLAVMRSRRLVREDGFNMDSFVRNSIDGLSANLERGKLGLVKAEAAKFSKAQMYDLNYLEGKKTGVVQDSNSATDARKPAEDIIDGLQKLLAPLKGEANGLSLDEASRNQIMNTLHSVAHDLETPFEKLGRLANTGRQLPAIKVGYQLGLYKTLTEAAGGAPVHVNELAKTTGASPALVNRVARYLAANGLIREATKQTYAANASTRVLADEAFEGGMDFFYGVSNPTAHALPAWLAERGFQNLQGGEGGRTVFQAAHDTDMELYPWLKTRPGMLRSFQRLMTLPRYSDWLTVVEFRRPDGDGVAFVDVGGNVGHQCRRLLAAHPELAGSVVLQDLEETISAAPPIEGVRPLAHDFFKPNPVKGKLFET
ncbi:hypothetical protein SLS64_003613 [Diaporthe eres]|uniref:O-methyltransferase dimerisation domain-containing protein n=1 Tax=Diaporthe eres TaxID=83184 RepID=A0ABR1NP44_DIAER